jgi:hypothetical protein
MDLLPITVDDEIAELRREAKLRASVYPRWVAAGRLKKDKADRYCEVLDSAIKRLESIRDAG